MSRHSLHSNDRSHFSYKERKDAGFCFTKKEVLGSDCFLPFGFCALSLKAPKDAVATPHGHIYDREFILEALVNQKVEAKAAQDKFDDQERRKAKKDAVAKHTVDNKEVEDFRKAEAAIVSGDYRHKRALDTAQKTDGEGPEAKLRKGELINLEKSEQRKNCFWVAECTQSAAPQELKKVDTATRCPMSNKKLKVKDLLKVNFEVTDQKMIDRGGDKGVYCCAVSKHPITHQQAYLIKPSGQVVLESVLKDCVLKDMKCPITGKDIKGKDDLLKLQMGGTGFSAHNKTDATSGCTIRAMAGDNRSLQGHLPAAGFCGLR